MLIEGVILMCLFFWLVNFVLCLNVIVSYVYCESFGFNLDGCDFESCIDVLIIYCVFDIGDDCIVIKLGWNVDGWWINVFC